MFDGVPVTPRSRRQHASLLGHAGWSREPISRAGASCISCASPRSRALLSNYLSLLGVAVDTLPGLAMSWLIAGGTFCGSELTGDPQICVLTGIPGAFRPRNTRKVMESIRAAAMVVTINREPSRWLARLLKLMKKVRSLR